MLSRVRKGNVLVRTKEKEEAMSEYINNRQKRKEILKNIIRQLHEGRTVDEVKAEFAAFLRDVGPTEIAEIEQALIDEGLPEMEIKRLCDVHVAVFRESLETQQKPETIPGHPVHTFRAENQAAAVVLDRLQKAIEALLEDPTNPVRLDEARQRLAEMREYEKHYRRKELFLFPYLERKGFSGPSTVMWAIHDDIRGWWKALAALLEAGPGEDVEDFRERVKSIFWPMATAIREMFYKEENILFPTSLQLLTEEDWRAIRAQEAEVGYAYVQPEEVLAAPAPAPTPAPAEVAPPPEARALVSVMLHLDTGTLSPEEVNLILNTLPVEVTYVDENDTVRYFNKPRERTFLRPPAVIGRKVQKCHPPASLHRVQRILDEFRAGKRDVAEFWIQMNGRFIHIRYFPLRDEQGRYRGTLEVVQDVTEIRALQGERRLLDEEPIIR
jgi:PAS domain S-box-containing protein